MFLAAAQTFKGNHSTDHGKAITVTAIGYPEATPSPVCAQLTLLLPLCDELTNTTMHGGHLHMLVTL